jgi:hypothetical protein
VWDRTPSLVEACSLTKKAVPRRSASRWWPEPRSIVGVPGHHRPSGNAAGAEVPAEIVEAFGAGKRAPMVTTINGYSWRSRVAAMRGQLLIGISTANRAASDISLGEEISSRAR